MSLALYLSRIPESLQLDAEGQIPDAWFKLDVLSQGLVSRYLARARGAPKDSSQTSSWVILRPFAPAPPRLYGIWNSKNPLTKNELAALKLISTECYLDKEAFASADLTLIQESWPELNEWTP
ncbi:MAG: hypothetical protein ABIR96_13055 [Bdellovibrionota bacterium]